MRSEKTSDERYEAYGFHVQRLADGWTTDDLRAALDAAEAESARPSLIIVRTHIAIGAPHAQDTPEAHGAPLGEEEVRLTKQAYGWDPDKHFYVPDEVYAHFSQLERGAADHAAWDAVHATRRRGHGGGARPRALGRAAPGLGGCAARLLRRERTGDAAGSGACIQALAAAIPEFVGGSADLAPSTTTTIKGPENVPGAPLSNQENAQADSVLPGRLGGRTFHFGIREHGMGAILNGFTVHGGFRAFGATFFVFSDYMRPAVRLACVMGLPVDLRVDARLHRARRGRPDAPADRAPRLAARHALHARHPPCRCHGDGRGLAARAGAHRRTRGTRRSRARSCPSSTAPRSRPRAACARAATCWPMRRARRPT